MPTLSIPFEYRIRSPSQINYARKKLNACKEEEDVKVFLFTDDMILHVENSKFHIKKNKNLLELIQYSVKLQDSKSAYKNQLHLYTLTTNHPKRKLRKQYHLQSHQKE